MTFMLDESEKKALLKIARDTIESYARTGQAREVPPGLSGNLTANAGAFVTLHKEGDLRGCIGTFMGEGPLAETVRTMALAAGWEDTRFHPLGEGEIKRIDIEISVLSPLQEIKDLNEIEVGAHGIFITKGWHRGVLLPQVAVEHHWDRDTFLSHTCMKAGLSADAWRREKLKIEIFSAQVFGEKDFAK